MQEYHQQWNDDWLWMHDNTCVHSYCRIRKKIQSEWSNDRKWNDDVNYKQYQKVQIESNFAYWMNLKVQDNMCQLERQVEELGDH